MGYGIKDKGEGIRDMGYGIKDKGEEGRGGELRTSNVERPTLNLSFRGEKGIREEGEGGRGGERRTSNVERRMENERPAPCSLLPAPRRPAVIGSDLSTATYSPRQPALWFALFLFAFADKVVTQTELNRRSLGRLAPWIRKKTVVIRNGLDLSRFIPRKRDMGYGIRDKGDGIGDNGEGIRDKGNSNSEQRISNLELLTCGLTRRNTVDADHQSQEPSLIQSRLRDDYPLSSDEGAIIPLPAAPPLFRFVVVGSVYSVKNPVRLVKAVKVLKDQGVSGFRVEWYGRLGLGKEAESGSAEYHEAMSLMETYQLGDVFRFEGETAEIHNILPVCDALIHPSLQEGFPNAVVEAMACGLPIVVSRVSDLPLVVETAKNGFVFDETDPQAIAEGMRKMLETGERERAEMGNRSRKLAEEWFGMERFVEEYVQLYEELAG
jgi:glycosyltransferase involved in cell wall biosynthesis